MQTQLSNGHGTSMLQLHASLVVVRSLATNKKGDHFTLCCSLFHIVYCAGILACSLKITTQRTLCHNSRPSQEDYHFMINEPIRIIAIKNQTAIFSSLIIFRCTRYNFLPMKVFTTNSIF